MLRVPGPFFISGRRQLIANDDREIRIGGIHGKSEKGTVSAWEFSADDCGVDEIFYFFLAVQTYKFVLSPC